jgi:glycine cleavage system H protein
MENCMSIRFSNDHVWIETLNSSVRVGITEHAQEALGDIVFVQFPQVGQGFSKNAVLAVIESVKAAADVVIPVGAKVLKINAQVIDNPALVNSDPLGLGWLVEVEMNDPSEVSELMDSSEYLKFCET